MNVHILFVDDEEHNLKIYQSAFQREYQVHIANGGNAALQILEEYPIKLLVTDQRMPNMTGTELLKEVSVRFPMVERMIVTAYSDLSVILQAVNEQRVFQYLLKPVDIGQLKMAVKGALHKVHIEEENRRLMHELAEANQNLEMKVEARTRELKMKNSILLTISQEVNAKNEKITQSLNYSKKLQAAILPTLGGLHRFIPESFIFQRPKDIVSGDFFWYKRLSEHTYIMAMADCTGHGIPGAFMTVLGSICLDLVFEKWPSHSPAQFLHALDEQMQQVLNGDHPESVSQDGMDIMMCIIDFSKREIKYSGARSIAYLVRNGEAMELKPSRYGIGFQPK